MSHGHANSEIAEMVNAMPLEEMPDLGYKTEMIKEG